MDKLEDLFPTLSEPFDVVEDVFGAVATYDGAGSLDEVYLPNFGWVDAWDDQYGYGE